MRNILFLTSCNVSNIDESGIYQDLLREFARRGHRVFVVSPTERRNQEKTHLIKNDNANILRVKTGNIQKTNLIEKGIATVLLEKQYISSIKKYLSDVKFDLVLYSTPPITLAGAVQYIKKRDGTKNYLLLKDIFPQNAVDIGMMRKIGLKGLLYWYFRAKEKKLYGLSDKIGCMSPANVDFVLKHNPDVSAEKVEVCPNCIEPVDMSISNEERIAMRMKYDIPLDKKVFVYGGNLGKPQGIPFLIDCLKNQANNEQSYFLIVGDGTEYGKLETYINENKPRNVKLMKRLPKEDYDRMIAACDVGMIFLDYRFTIPNFPSRLLSYMQAKLPVLCVTDQNTDVGRIAAENGFGWWCKSNDIEEFNACVDRVLSTNLLKMGDNARKYLESNYDVRQVYAIILKFLRGEKDENFDCDGRVFPRTKIRRTTSKCR